MRRLDKGTPSSSTAPFMVLLVCVLLSGCGSGVFSDASIPAGWRQYVDAHSGLIFEYPEEWTPDADGPYTYFSAGDVEIFEVRKLAITGTLQQAAAAVVMDNACPAVDDNGQPADRSLKTASNGIFLVLSCSATTQDFVFLTHNSAGNIVQLSYHDNFPADTALDATPALFQMLASTAH